jgi:putative addiction module killer protein
MNSHINENGKKTMVKLLDYVSPDGADVFGDWIKNLRDRQARLAITRRLGRVELGNFGDHRYCRDGVWELRIDVGPGYRVYYGILGGLVVLLLSGSDKRRQDAEIDRACYFWREWQQRKGERG